jgi:hypothetical protein
MQRHAATGLASCIWSTVLVCVRFLKFFCYLEIAFSFQTLKVISLALRRPNIGFLFCSLAFLQLLGGHWAVLQMGAWADMLLRYSHDAGLIAGISQTFDGGHPCPICKAIQAGKKQEQKKAPLLNSELKRDYLATWNHFQVRREWAEVVYPRFAEHLHALAIEPDVPPPRS